MNSTKIYGKIIDYRIKKVETKIEEELENLRNASSGKDNKRAEYLQDKEILLRQEKNILLHSTEMSNEGKYMSSSLLKYIPFKSWYIFLILISYNRKHISYDIL
jgi:hypothetical protein